MYRERTYIKVYDSHNCSGESIRTVHIDSQIVVPFLEKIDLNRRAHKIVSWTETINIYVATRLYF